MKIPSALVIGAVLASPLCAKNVPTPDMAVSFNMSKDPKKWVGQLTAAEDRFIIFELVPQGESVKAWTEMVEQQIAFTPATLRNYVDVWEKGMSRADPKINVNEQTNKDGSLVVAYASNSAQEISVRRFIKARDGIYMLAYLVRPSSRNEARLNMWISIIEAATLVPNPNKR